MSIIPFIVSDVLSDPWSNRRSSRICNPHFGLRLSDEDIFEPVPQLLHLHYHRPKKSLISKFDHESTVVADQDKFEVSLDVQQFAPNEIQVKAIDDNHIIVEGKHEEKKDEHGYISRQFTRRYVLPEGYDGKKIASSLSSDGVLTVSAPKLTLETNATERTIPITKTGPVNTQVVDEKSKI